MPHYDCFGDNWLPGVVPKYKYCGGVATLEMWESQLLFRAGLENLRHRLQWTWRGFEQVNPRAKLPLSR